MTCRKENRKWQILGGEKDRKHVKRQLWKRI